MKCEAMKQACIDLLASSNASTAVRTFMACCMEAYASGFSHPEIFSALGRRQLPELVVTMNDDTRPQISAPHGPIAFPS
jgi:hypothetical protein